MRKRLREEAKKRGEFARVQACPTSPNDVADEPEVKLVILGPESPHDPKLPASPARVATNAILSRGATGRQCANALVFLAADKTRLAELESALRQSIAWQSIERDPVGLNLDEFQKDQARKRREKADFDIRQRIPEAYVWLMAPEQPDPGQPVGWWESRIQGSNGLAERAYKKLEKEARLVATWSGTLLRMELDKIPLWRGNHVSLKQLVEDFAKYTYLTRLRSADTLPERRHLKGGDRRRCQWVHVAARRLCLCRFVRRRIGSLSRIDDR